MMKWLAPTLLRFRSLFLSAPREQDIQTEPASPLDSAIARDPVAFLVAPVALISARYLPRYLPAHRATNPSHE
jgi:hypothetical protein